MPLPDVSMTLKIVYLIASILSIGLYVGSVQFRKKANILICQTFASVCYGICYFIIGAWSGFYIEIIEQTKDILFVKYELEDKPIPKFALIIVLAALIIVSVITFDGVGSLLPLIINIAYFVSSYMKNPKYIRIVMIICGFLWAIYNFYVGAYIIIVGNVLEIISALIAMYRFDKKTIKE